MARERAKRCHYERTRIVRGRHLWANRNPATPSGDPEQGRSVFELVGDEMDDLALALHLARDTHEPRPEHDAALVLEEAAPDDGVERAGLVLEGQEHHAGGRARPLAGDDEAGGMRAPDVVSPNTSRADWKERRVSTGRRSARGWRRRVRPRLP